MRQQPLSTLVVGRLGILIWCFLSAWLLPAQNVTQIEYFVDADPGFGKGTAVSITAAADLTKTFSVPVNGLDPGFHRLYVRAKDANGHWSLSSVRTFYKETIDPVDPLGKITRVEYFVDSDPGFGKGTSVAISPGTDLTNVAFSVNLSTLDAGFHRLYVRALDANGRWSVASLRTFYKENLGGDPTKLAKITRLEYFVNEDPGFGKGTSVAISSGEDLTNVVFNVPLTTVPDGFNKLYIRALDANGRWSLASVRAFYKEKFTEGPNTPLPNIVKGEYFVDEDPGFGKGKTIPLTASADLTNLTTALDIADVSIGIHKLYVRFRDARGNWSLASVREFEVKDDGDPYATLGTIAGSPFCAGATVAVPFTVNKAFGTNNVFTAQLSDGNGNFGNATNIGTLTSPNSGTISARLPAFSPGFSGSGYKIRVIASSPLDTTTASPELTIRAVPAAASITGKNNACIGSETYSVTPLAGVSYVWKVNKQGNTDSTTVATDATATISWTAPGNYYLTVIPSNACGAGPRFTQFVHVDQAVPITAPEIVATSATILSVLSNPGNYTVQWYKDGTKVNDSGNSINIATRGNGIYTARFANNCGPGPVSNSITVNGGIDQTITLQPVPDKTFGDEPFALVATASSGLDVAFSLSTSPGGIASLNDNTVTILGVGTVTVTASQAGNATYNGASTTQTFKVQPKAATLTLSNLIQTYDGTPKQPTAITTPSGLPVGFTFNGSATVPVNAGSYAVVATITNANYSGTANGTLVIEKAGQTLTVESIPAKVTTDSPFNVMATASSGLAVTITVISGPATAKDNTITLTKKAGTVQVRASQTGNENYNAAPEVNQEFIVNKATQTIVFDPIPDKLPTDPPFAVSARASSGLPVALSIEKGPATIAGSTVTLTGKTGEVTVKATQAGDDTYAAVSESRTFKVNDAPRQNQTITFAGLANKTYGDAPFALNATASSGLEVSFVVTEGPATLNGKTLTVTGVGEVTITASQAGNDAYNAAEDVSQTFTVTRKTLTVTAQDKSKAYGEENPVLTLTYFGFVNGEDAEDLDALPTATTTATTGSNAGSYPITVSGGSDDNYAFGYVSGTLTISKADQLITIAPFTCTAVGATCVIEASANSGLPVTLRLVSGPAAVVENEPNRLTIRVTGPGTLVIEAAQAGNANYTRASAEKTFTIGPAPAYPDVAVLVVTANKAVLSPGEEVTLSWQVANQGNANAPVDWTERLYMQSPNGQNRTLLKQLDFKRTEALGEGKTLSRSETLTLPTQLVIGDEGVFVVELVPGSSLEEAPNSEANNTGIQTTPWTLRKQLMLELSAAELTEGAGTGISATVRRSGSLANPLTVSVSLSKPARFSFPATLTIPAGETGITFALSAPDNNALEGTLTDTLRVSATGFPSAKAPVSLLDNDRPSLSIAQLPAQATEGQTVSFQVKTDLKPAQPLQVFLTSSSGARFPVPPSVTIPAGALSTTVTVELEQDEVPEIDQAVTLTAGAANHQSASDSILVKDDDLPNLELVLETNLVAESAGLYATKATLRRTAGSNSLPFTANLSASLPNTLILPPTVSLAQGENEKTFTVGVVDNTLADGERNVLITASIFVNSCGCSAPPSSSGSVSASLTVSDNDGAALELTASPLTLPEGVAAAGMLRITRNTATTKALTVKLSSSDTGEATVPATAVIPAGKAFVEVPITTVNDGVVDGNQQVYFQATAEGFSTGSVWVLVSDQNKPDLQITAVTLSSTSVQAKALFNYQVSVKNTGFATAPTGLVVRGYLSKDGILDENDTLITEDVLTAAIPVGATVPVVNAIQAPNRPGSYRLFFKVNPQASLTELLLTNNTSEGVAFTIKPDYTATVSVPLPYYLRGTAVPITGSAKKSDGTPATNVPVEVYVITSGLRRTLLDTTDASGNISTQFIPLTKEAGHYSVGASFPGMEADKEQDAFDIVGVRVNEGKIAQFKVTLNEPLRGTLSVENLSGTNLTNFSLVPASLPNGAQVRFDTVAAFAGNSSINLPYTVVGTALSPGTLFEVATLQAVAKEGTIQSVDVFYYSQAPGAFLVADVTELKVTASQSKGERLVEFRLVNKGMGNTGAVSINLPEVNWLSSLTPASLPSLAPGDTATVMLKFLASAEVPFDYPIKGSIGVAAQNGNSFAIPFSFEKVPQANGGVRVTVTDQFTYYTEGAPNVAGAFVSIKNYFSGETYAEGYTDNNGIFAAGNVPEGNHRITVDKDKHLPYGGTITVDPGDTTRSTVFINYQAITFSWKVVPTAIEDKYEITLETQFETHVPVPVVTIEMPKVMPRLSGSNEYAFNVVLTNHGLITAKDVTLNLPTSDPEYEFVTNYSPADLLAQQSIQVPVIMRRRTGAISTGKSGGPTVTQISRFLGMQESQYGAAAGQSLDCQVFTNIVWWYKCNLSSGLWEKGGVLTRFEGRVCGGNGGPSREEVVNVLGMYAGAFPDCAICPDPSIFDGNRGWKNPFKYEKKNCVDCLNELSDAISGCLDLPPALSCIPKAYISQGGPKAYAECLIGALVPDPVEMIKDKLVSTITDKIPYYSQLECLYDLLSALATCLQSATDQDQRQATGLAPRTLNTGGYSNVLKEMEGNLKVVHQSYQARVAWLNEYYGDLSGNGSWNRFSALIYPYVSGLVTIPDGVQATILQKMVGYDMPLTGMKAFFQRWNLSIEARDKDILSPNAEYPGIINWARVKKWSDSLVVAHNFAVARGFDDVNAMNRESKTSLDSVVNQQQQAVCASVTIQFNQQLTMTREAFEGTLDIFNGHPTDKMDSLSVVIEITDRNGVPSNGVFEIQTKKLTNLSDVTGTGQVGSQQNGTVQFLFIPELGAAPTEPKEYNFGGYVRYFDPYAQAMVKLPLNPVPLTVNPSPNLMLHYFMERNILGDDALTKDVIEPSVPAELAVMVENQGYGPAVNMVISSAQPKIVENEKGLAINFNIIGSNFQGKPKNLGVLDVNFGTIPPLETRIGQWYFTSSLLGKFVSYEASVVHSNSFGNPELSLVKGVKLHELTKSIRLYGALEDGINDFLVNDIFDVKDVPDVIYFSQGNRTEKVYQATSGSFSAPVSGPAFTNTLTVTPSDTGWNYVKLVDPGNRLYELVSVTRSDGQVIPLDNAWLTFVTLPVSRPPVYENKFHLVDAFPSLSPVTYTVVWKPRSLDVPNVVSISGVPGGVTAEQVETVTVAFSKPIDGASFTHEDLTLTFQGGPNIITNSVTITQLDPVTFAVDLSKLTTGNGFYNLTVQAAGVQDVYGISGQVGKQATWTQFLTVPAVQAFLGLPQGNTAAAFDTVRVLFNLSVDESTVTPARFILSKDGVALDGALTIDSVRADKKLFYLSGLSKILTESGTYTLIVDLPNIKSVEGVAGKQEQSVALTVDNTGPQVLRLEKSTAGGLDAQHVTSVVIEFNENVKGFNTASLQLTRNGEAVALPITALSNADLQHWTAAFSTLTYPEGEYKLTLNLAGFTDAIGNPGTGTRTLSWTVDRSAVVAISNVTVSSDLGFSDSDGITSGLEKTVSFNLGSDASRVVLYQTDLSGEAELKIILNVKAGVVSVPVTLLTGGNTGVRVRATGANGGVGLAEKQFFVDQTALSSQWLLAPNQLLSRQVDTVAVAFSARLLDSKEFLKALQFRRNGVALSKDALSVEAVNDTTYRVLGLRQASSVPGNYLVVLNAAAFRKYSSGLQGSGSPTVSWTVQSLNQPPVAKAGRDTTITSTGVVHLDGSASADPDADAITYRWIAPQGVTLTDSLSETPSFTITSEEGGNTYTFLLIVSDGVLFATDAVTVRVNLGKTDQRITFGPLPDKTYGDKPFLLLATASSGLPVSYRIRALPEGIVALSGDTVTILGAGKVTVTASQPGNGNYYSAPTVERSFVIRKATPAVTWNPPAPIRQGTPLSEAQLNAAADIAGTFTYTSAAGTVLPVGTHSLYGSFTPSDTANYSQVKGLQRKITVTQAELCQNGLCTLRINAGGGTYTDQKGNVFLADTYFIGGGATQPVTGEVASTDDDELYRQGRYGEWFLYQLPSGNGVFNVVLHYAEPYWGSQVEGGAGSRKFNVLMQGTVRASEYDIYEQAGGAMRAVKEVYRVTVKDGLLSIRFNKGSANYAYVSAIEVIPAGKEFRVNAGGKGFLASGNRWFLSDTYAAGGQAAPYAMGEVAATEDDQLYNTLRTGALFNYNFPTGPGTYDVTLHFNETYWGKQAAGGVGSRKFNVHIENEPKLVQYDIFAKAGEAMHAVEETFRVTVKDQVLNVRFTKGSADVASLAAIEVLPVAPTARLAITGLEPTAELPWKAVLYPDPVEDELTILLDAPANLIKASEVTDAAGNSRLVNAHQVTEENKLKLDVKNLKSGFYLLRLQTAGDYKVFKFMKR